MVSSVFDFFFYSRPHPVLHTLPKVVQAKKKGSTTNDLCRLWRKIGASSSDGDAGSDGGAWLWRWSSGPGIDRRRSTSSFSLFLFACGTNLSTDPFPPHSLLAESPTLKTMRARGLFIDGFRWYGNRYGEG
ncbi:unnamed protein product [Lactuca virosa]|uniref:Uncharacterized protein n=1 Tax=Lactuca virosa TaxID=75947 RepID=A0AAU9LSY1_9ASTR|nr:unnamed protein product [Lactuca virosa]